MKKLILTLIATALTLSGCHIKETRVIRQPSKTVVVEETVYTAHTPSHSTTTVVEEVVVVEEVQYCDYYGSMPFYEDPYQCYVGWGCYEVWEYDEYSCEWYYAFDYCV
jgi:hypothetical protein